MNPTSIVVIFVILWWIIFFMILPVGIVTDKAEGGNMNGAPKNPNIKIKMLATTAITIIAVAIYYYMVSAGYIVWGS